MRYSTTTLTASWLNVIPTVLWQAALVEKASKCLDFTVTITVVHWVCMLCYDGGTPGWQFSYWLHIVAWSTVTCLLAEALCMKLETAEIKLTINDLIDTSAKGAKSLISLAKGKKKLGRKSKGQPPAAGVSALSRIVDNKKVTHRRHKKDEHV